MNIADLEEHRRRREEEARASMDPLHNLADQIRASFRKKMLVARYQHRIGIARHNSRVRKRKGKRLK